MPERTSYAPGTPCWIDLSTPDQDAAGAFYGALFGWTLEEDENAEQTGGYRVAMLKGKAVGGVMKIMEEGQPPAWSTYICAESADATVAKAREARGNVMFEPMDVLDYGRMAFVVDPTGAVVGVWQPGRNIGAGIVNEPGAFSWAELNTRDPEAAKAFYGAVAGWGFQDNDMGEMGTYVSVMQGDRSIAGILDISERGVPDEVPAHWLVYFATEDTDATVSKATEGGGNVIVEPFETPAGRIAILQDPFGAVFGVVALSEEALANA